MTKIMLKNRTNQKLQGLIRLRDLLLMGLTLSLFLVTTATATVIKSDDFDSRADWDGCSDPPSGWSTYFWNNNYCNRVAIGGSWDDAHGANGKSLRITWPGSILELGMTTYNVSGQSHVWTGFWWRHDPGYSMGADNQDKWIYFNEVGGVRNMLSHKNDTLCFFDGSNYNLCTLTGTTPDTHPNTSGTNWTNDTSWHYFTILADPANDDIRVWRDGTELRWNGDNLNAGWSGTRFDNGFMTWGYQSRSGWNGHVSYFDDIIAATTKVEVDDFLDTAGATAPPPTTDPTNAPPMANAGSNPTVTDIDGNGFEQVQLNGSGSSDPDGSIVSHEWREGTVLLASAPVATVNISVGTHAITLTVTDNQGAQASDTISLTVEPNSSGSGGSTTNEVLLQETFDNASTSARGWYDAGATAPAIVADIQKGNVLEYSYPSGSSTPSTGAMRHLFQESDELTLSYNVKYQSGWSWILGDSGPHEFYLMTNLDSAWKGPAASHGTTYIEMHNGIQRLGFQDALNIDQTNIGSNLVSISENRGVFGCNGTSDQYPDGICWGNSGARINGKLWDVSMNPIQNDRWYQVKVHFKMNSIINGIGIADGVMEYWLDGQLKMSLNDVVIRTGANPNLKWNQIMIAPYYHNGTPGAQKFWIDNLIINNTSATSPAAPTGLRLL